MTHAQREALWQLVMTIAGVMLGAVIWAVVLESSPRWVHVTALSVAGLYLAWRIWRS